LCVEPDASHHKATTDAISTDGTATYDNDELIRESNIVNCSSNNIITIHLL